MALSEVQIVAATYGENCGAPHGNVTAPLAQACNGKTSCHYVVDYHVLGDPAPGCAKTFNAEWTCAAGQSIRHANLPAEAGHESPLFLACGVPAAGIHLPHALPPPVAAAPPPPAAAAPPPPFEVPAPAAAAPAEAELGPEPNYTVVPVYFATDRVHTGSSNAGKMFGATRGGMNYGTCKVSIPNHHKMGELESPSIWKLEFHPDPEKHVVLLDVTVTAKDALLGQLAESMRTSEAKSAFVFVHGYNVTFEDAARRTAQMAYDLNFHGVPIFFSWPSRGRTAAYTVDEQSIESSQPNLEQFLVDILANTAGGNVYLVAHSMGNRALTRAFAALIVDNPSLAARVKELILTAPDIDADVFKQQIVPQLLKLGTPTTLYASASDLALKISKTVHGGPRAGDVGPNLVIAPGMDTIDATAVDTSLVGHSYFAEEKSVLSDIYYLIRDNSRAQARFGLEEVVVGAGRYWEFKP